jgi:uncharacterized protein (DUF1810 family)
MTDSRLERFVTAQREAGAGFDAAAAELRAGGKRGHWIWYIFPQLAGLGASWNAQHYGLAGIDEAAAYLDHPVLGPRLLSIAEIVAEQLRRGIRIDRLMGSEIDALKLVSSFTLFEQVANARGHQDEQSLHSPLKTVAREILAAAEEQGYPRCRFTLEHVRPSA